MDEFGVGHHIALGLFEQFVGVANFLLGVVDAPVGSSGGVDGVAGGRGDIVDVVVKIKEVRVVLLVDFHDGSIALRIEVGFGILQLLLRALNVSVELALGGVNVRLVHLGAPCVLFNACRVRAGVVDGLVGHIGGISGVKEGKCDVLLVLLDAPLVLADALVGAANVFTVLLDA